MYDLQYMQKLYPDLVPDVSDYPEVFASKTESILRPDSETDSHTIQTGIPSGSTQLINYVLDRYRASDILSIDMAFHGGEHWFLDVEKRAIFQIIEDRKIPLRILINSEEALKNIWQHTSRGYLAPGSLDSARNNWAVFQTRYPNSMQVRTSDIPLMHRITPWDVTEFSHFEATWVCPKGHEFPMPVYRRSRGCGCSICAGKLILAGYNDIESQAPHLALEWDDERNGNIKPSMVALHSNDRYHWKCTVCGHRWKVSPNNRSKGTGCPACKHCCVDPLVNSLAVVNPKLAGQWDHERNAPFTPWNVATYDNRDYFWVCEEGHSWPASPANRNKGTDCPYCKGKRPISGEKDLKSQRPELSKRLHPTRNGDMTAVDYFVESTKYVWWECDECGYVFYEQVQVLAREWSCPNCDSRSRRRRRRI